MLSRKRSGFTLIEMLVVIAIIAVLAAIIFPVFAGVQKQAKKSQCMANMSHIYTALKMFQIEEHRYPEFIAGPVQRDPNDLTKVISVDKSSGTLDYSPTWRGHAFSLYPEYLKNVNDLRCPLAPNNIKKDEVIADPLFTILNALPWNPPDDGKATKPVRIIGWDDAQNNKYRFELYKFSSYDWQVPPGCADTTNGETHYSNVWYNGFMSDANAPYCERQLKWRNPPAETVVTWCSYHRSMNGALPDNGSKDLVLFADGHVAQIPSHWFFQDSNNGNAAISWSDAWRVVGPDCK